MNIIGVLSERAKAVTYLQHLLKQPLSEALQNRHCIFFFYFKQIFLPVLFPTPFPLCSCLTAMTAPCCSKLLNVPKLGQALISSLYYVTVLFYFAQRGQMFEFYSEIPFE